MSGLRTHQSACVLNRSNRRSQVLALAAAATLFAGSAWAADIFKSDNLDALNLTTAWSTSVAPTAIDTAVYGGLITSGPITNALGANQTWGGIKILSPAGVITISAGNTLTIGQYGIDMSNATQNLTISAAMTLQSYAQAWNVASTQTLTLASMPTKFNGATGGTGTNAAILHFSDTGTINIGSATAPLILDSQNNPMATYGLNDWAALNAGRVVAATYTNTDSGTLTAGANNSVTADTTGGAPAAVDMASMRFNDPTARTVNVSNSATSRTMTARGILVTANSGGGTITGSGGPAGTSSFLRPNRVSSGAGAPTAFPVITNSASDFTIGVNISNGSSSTPTTLVKDGTGKLILNYGTGVALTNGYSGGTVIDNGTLQIGNGGTTGYLGSGDITDNGNITFAHSDAITVIHNILGAGSITQAGPGELTFTTNNSSFTGAVSLAGGTLTFTQASNLGAATTNIQFNGGTLKYAAANTLDISSHPVTLASNGTINTNGNDVVYANAIGGGGGGSLTKVGNGILTLQGVNTYTGGTVVNGGTLRVSNATGAHPGPVTVNTGGTLGGVGTISGTSTVYTGGTLAPGASVGTLHTGALDLEGGSLANWEFASTSSYDQVIVDNSGGLTLNGGAFSLLNENLVTPFSSTGSYNLIKYTGAIAGSGTSSLSVANPQPGKTYAFDLNGGYVRLTIGTAGVVSQWITNGGGSWSGASNWSPATVPNAQGATANFTTNLSAPSTVTLDGDKTVGAAVFQSANGYTIAQGTGGSLKLWANGSSLASLSDLQGDHTISAPVSMLSATQISAAAGTALSITNVLSGASGLTVSKNGPGTLVLAGNNTFAGDVQINDGTLAVSHNNALGTGITNLNTTGSLRADANVVIPNNLTINPSAAGVIDTQGFTMTLSNAVDGYGAFNKVGAGTLILANNEGAATTTISAGTVRIGAGGTSGSIGTNFINNGAVILNRSDDLSFNNSISGTGSFSKENANIATFSTGETYSGDTTIMGGTLAIGGANCPTNSTLNYNNQGGKLSFGVETTATLGGLKGAQNLAASNESAAGVALSVGSNGISTTYSGNLDGTAVGASLTKIGAGTLTLTGSSTFNQASTTLTGGVLEVAAGGKFTGTAVVFGINTGNTNRLLVSGGRVDLSGTSDMTQGNLGVQITSGTLNMAGLVMTQMTSPNSNTLLRVDGGVATIGTFNSGRSAIAVTTEQTTGSTASGIYVTGGHLIIPGTVGLGNTTTTNSGQSMYVTGGQVDIGGAATLSVNNVGRWSFLVTEGGVTNFTDTVTGLVLGGANSIAGGNYELLVRNNTANTTNSMVNIERLQFGTGAIPTTASTTGNALAIVNNGALYMGSGGMVIGTTNTGSFTSTLRLTAGTLGANADWTGAVPVVLANTTDTMYIKAANAAGDAHNITLSAVASGTGGFNKIGAGTVTLTGINTYTGNTTVTTGTLVLGPAAHAPVITGAGAILNGGKLVMDHTGGATDPKAAIVPDLATNAPSGFQAGRAHTTLAVDTTKAIGWQDDGNIFQARYTYKGDIDLSGKVDSLDFNTFVGVGNYGLTSGAIWANGDSNYDGKVNTLDFNDLAGNFGLAPFGGALPGGTPAPTLGSVVPEPSTLSLIGIGSMAMIARRRRNAR